MLHIIASYHPMQFPGEPMIQTQENGKKCHFDPDLGPFGPNTGHNFFFKNLALSVTRYHGQLSSCTISENTNDPILRKFSDGQADERDFIGRCPTKVERPIGKYFKVYY